LNIAQANGAFVDDYLARTLQQRHSTCSTDAAHRHAAAAQFTPLDNTTYHSSWRVRTLTWRLYALPGLHAWRALARVQPSACFHLRRLLRRRMPATRTFSAVAGTYGIWLPTSRGGCSLFLSLFLLYLRHHRVTFVLRDTTWRDLAALSIPLGWACALPIYERPVLTVNRFYGHRMRNRRTLNC